MISSPPHLLYPHLTPATFLHKPNRFVAVVEAAGETFLAHVPTSSRMRELLAPGAAVWLAPMAGVNRKTAWSLVLARYGETLVSVDSLAPNRLLARALAAGAVPEFAGWALARREAFFGRSRFDFLLARDAAQCWLEAKSVTLVEDGTALFPDAPTARGARHLEELIAARQAGHRAAVLFIIQRGDAVRFSPNRPLDPAFADALSRAVAAGVEAYAYRCSVTLDGIRLGERVTGG
ncbi:MAG: Sugar fermentation stimulation protein A [bacterium ADurb.Bin429]|nr:MAG: Sugar fermentation stimulation protein A [bacterium ADurb.Bin429]